MNSRRSHPAERGVALVTTVIVVAVLAVVAVAFMQSTSMDRLSSRTVTNYFAARLAAEAAAGLAQGEVARLIARYPDSATVWQNIGGNRTNEATVLYVRAQANNTNLGARPGQFGPEVTLLAQALVSGAKLERLNDIGNCLPYAPGDTNMINLNTTNASQPDPWIGYRSSVLTNTNMPVRQDGSPVTAAQWVYLGQFPGPISSTNPPIARYAYWVEDESFKVNVNVATNGLRGATSLGLSPAESRLDGAWVNSRDAALSATNAQGEVLPARRAITARNGLAGREFPTAATAAVPMGLESAAAAELRFLTTSLSAGLDISRGGFRRFNINTVTNGISGPTDANNIRRNLDRVIAAITNSNSVPNFGQRFYRLSTNGSDVNVTNVVPANHAIIYLNKIAANALDYIDADDQPIYINNDSGFSIRVGTPDLADNTLFNEGIGGQGTNRMAAMGVEARPFLYGYAMSVQLTNMSPPGFQSTNSGGPGPPTPDQAEFDMMVDHHFEFWNPSTRDIVVGRGTNTNEAYLDGLFLQVANAPGWIDRRAGRRFAQPGSKDFKADLPAGTRFPANGTILVTTAPLSEARRLYPAAGQIESIHRDDLDDIRRVSGVTTTNFASESSSFPLLDRFYTVSLDFRNSVGGFQGDYETEMLLGTPAGVVDSFPALVVTNFRVWSRSNSTDFAINRHTLHGNVSLTETSAPRPAEGDPRTTMEQLQLQPYASGSVNNPHQTRFFADSGTIGRVNSSFTRPTEWLDYSTFTVGPNNAPMVVRNASLSSVGELGHLTDPARVPAMQGDGNPSLTNVVYSRSGGRTLRVGQPEHPRWYENTNLSTGFSLGVQTNASRTWTSWRLADIFTTKTNLSMPGLVNPNGLLRDNGMALRAALYGLQFLPSPDGAPSTAGKSLAVTNINGLVTNALARMTNTNGWTPSGAVNPFWERGEISELSAFNTNSAGANVPLGSIANMGTTFDRGREEIVRRSIEMITTRGSVFSAYIVAQALQVAGNATNVVSTARLKTTFEVIPQFANGGLSDDFNPGSGSAIEARFNRATNYTTKVLSSFYD